MLSRCQELRLPLLGEHREWLREPGRCRAPHGLAVWPDTLPLRSCAPVSDVGWDKGLWEGCQRDKPGMPGSSGSACHVSGCHVALPAGFMGDVCVGSTSSSSGLWRAGREEVAILQEPQSSGGRRCRGTSRSCSKSFG